MSKKIVILNGSPRKKGNTSALVRAFTEGAESSGNTVTEFFLDSMDIHGCKGCFGGHSSRECPCVQKDDMDKISRSFFADSSYMLSFSVLCSCVCSRLISPSVSSWHKQDNTLMHQSPGHIQRRTPYNF